MTVSTSRRVLCCLLIAVATGCDRAPLSIVAPAWREWPLPVEAGRQPDLVVAPDGSLLLSWIEGDTDAQHLRFARWRDGRWSAPRSVAHGAGIGNAADMPHVRQTADGALWATWLQGAGDSHARDLVLARSSDDGLTWSAPETVNLDGTAAEHGFASLWPEGRDALGIAWLDGRATAPSAGHAEPPALAGATMLRTAVFDARLARRDEQAIDEAACDCCQTDVAPLDDGPRLVYRDRLPGEIRDISILRGNAGGWDAPRRVHADGWAIEACPVNGPAVAASGRVLAVAWYTMQAARPTVRHATSRDGGAHFDAPLDLASSARVLGRVDVARDRDGAWVLWLEEDAGGQALRLARVADGATRPVVTTLARLAGRGHGTGWPRLVSTPGGVHAVWTDVVDGTPRLRGRRLAAAAAGAG